ncbi:unnamed protein product [Moneuplotes crassus]|uniref:Uncharacterized protein n=1 Tax=Euplotes crassus TaxID=5936 RepID=A0AAD1X9A7_EUPCR|nr:unnamed protein product [Moneuplotes crassus]
MLHSTRTKFQKPKILQKKSPLKVKTRLSTMLHLEVTKIVQNYLEPFRSQISTLETKVITLQAKLDKGRKLNDDSWTKERNNESQIMDPEWKSKSARNNLHRVRNRSATSKLGNISRTSDKLDQQDTINLLKSHLKGNLNDAKKITNLNSSALEAYRAKRRTLRASKEFPRNQEPGSVKISLNEIPIMHTQSKISLEDRKGVPQSKRIFLTYRQSPIKPVSLNKPSFSIGIKDLKRSVTMMRKESLNDKNGTQSPETFFTATLNDSQEEETCQCEGGFSTPPKAYCNQFCKYLSPDQQLKIIATESTCKNEDSLEGEYAINSEWWRAWCDYVNIEFQQAFTISIPDTKECQSSRKRLTELFVPAERKAVLGSNQNELVSFISSSNNGGRSSCSTVFGL